MQGSGAATSASAAAAADRATRNANMADSTVALNSGKKGSDEVQGYVLSEDGKSVVPETHTMDEWKQMAEEWRAESAGLNPSTLSGKNLASAVSDAPADALSPDGSGSGAPGSGSSSPEPGGPTNWARAQTGAGVQPEGFNQGNPDSVPITPEFAQESEIANPAEASAGASPGVDEYLQLSESGTGPLAGTAGADAASATETPFATSETTPEKTGPNFIQPSENTKASAIETAQNPDNFGKGVSYTDANGENQIVWTTNDPNTGKPQTYTMPESQYQTYKDAYYTAAGQQPGADSGELPVKLSNQTLQDAGIQTVAQNGQTTPLVASQSQSTPTTGSNLVAQAQPNASAVLPKNTYATAAQGEAAGYYYCKNCNRGKGGWLPIR